MRKKNEKLNSNQSAFKTKKAFSDKHQSEPINVNSNEFLRKTYNKVIN